MNDTHGSLSAPVEALFISVRPVGSRVTCNPQPPDTDRDFLCLTDDLVEVKRALSRVRFRSGGSTSNDEDPSRSDDRFMSLKRDDTNLIITESPKFYRRFLAATAIAKRLNLLNKADRVALFQAVLYGNEPPT